MDALEVLKQAHEEAKAAFKKIEEASPEERAGHWAKLRPELEAHEQYEEKLVYGPVSEDARGRDERLASWMQQHHAEASEADTLIEVIGMISSTDQRWLDRVMKLQQTLAQHIEEEERDIFPRIRQVWGQDRLESVGKQVQAAKMAAGAAGGVSGAVESVTHSVMDAFRKLTPS